MTDVPTPDVPADEPERRISVTMMLHSPSTPVITTHHHEDGRDWFLTVSVGRYPVNMQMIFHDRAALVEWSNALAAEISALTDRPEWDEPSHDAQTVRVPS